MSKDKINEQSENNQKINVENQSNPSGKNALIPQELRT
jgi:hypothetical protein